MFKRVILKLSGEYLSGEMNMVSENEPVLSSFSHYDYEIADKIVSSIAEALSKGVQIGIVIGGGNFWRGSEAPYGFNRAKADNMGMLASVMNGIFLSERFASFGIKAHIMTPFAVGGMTKIYNQDVADSYLSEANTVVIFPGGTGLPYFSTDTISIIRGSELKADCVLFAKDVEGVCDRDPYDILENETYTVYKEITATEMIANSLQVVDTAAMVLARNTTMNCILFDIRVDNSIVLACTNEKIDEIGTKISCL